MITFRVHHILCTNLYRGYGYSGAFCENMTEKVTWLTEHRKEKLLLITEADEICAKCPNLVDGKYCTNGDNHVHVKDLELLESLHLQENQTYSYEELMEHGKKYLEREVFEDSCKSCTWFQEGVCKYEDFQWD